MLKLTVSKDTHWSNMSGLDEAIQLVIQSWFVISLRILYLIQTMHYVSYQIQTHRDRNIQHRVAYVSITPVT